VSPHFSDTSDPDWPRRLQAVIEIVPGRGGDLPENLLRNIYRASQGGVIALALTDVTAAIVNKVMDRIVPLFPLTIPGIRYIDTANRSMLARIIYRADVAFGDTVQFRRTAVEVGFEPPLPFSWQFGADDGRPMAPPACASRRPQAVLPAISLPRVFPGEECPRRCGETSARQDARASETAISSEAQG
jgi:hypothetical protein